MTLDGSPASVWMAKVYGCPDTALGRAFGLVHRARKLTSTQTTVLEGLHQDVSSVRGGELEDGVEHLERSVVLAFVTNCSPPISSHRQAQTPGDDIVTVVVPLLVPAYQVSCPPRCFLSSVH